MKIFLAGVPAVLCCVLVACATAPAQKPYSFALASTASTSSRQAWQDYVQGKLLPNGLHYGDSVRHLHIAQRTVQDLDHEMTDVRHCRKKVDVIREPVKNQPKLDSDGKAIPLIMWLCADGGVVRIKPKGDPTSKYNQEPLGSKTLLYPYDTKDTSFASEALKVDEDGSPLPKYPKELQCTDKPCVDNWAAHAHSDLAL